MSSAIGKPRERMLFDLVKGLFDEVGITRDDIGTFVLNSNDNEVGHTIANVFEDTPVGAYMKDETHVDSDGLWAASYAAMRVMSGNYETALVVSDSSGASTFRPYLVMDYQLNPVYDRQIGLLNELSTAALQAKAYLDKYGASEDDLNEIAAWMLRNAAKNPNAVRSNAKASAGDVLAGDYYYEPLRELQCYPFTDGACAMIIASEKKAKELTDKPVWIKGMSSSVETYFLGERDLATSRATRLAGERAFKMAGVTDPAKQLDLAEVSVKFAHQLPIFAEALGLFTEGSAAKVTADGAFPVCPSGGGLGGYVFTSAGLFRIAECVRQLQGIAGDAQISGAKSAVAHGQDGFCAQHDAVMVLSTEEG
jgi:acetyl-CoA C-acetyltransferase